MKQTIKVAILRSADGKSLCIRDVPTIEEKLFKEGKLTFVRHYKTIWEVVKIIDLDISQIKLT
jgi:hypothetical protein